MVARLLTGAVWCAVAATAVGWGLALASRGMPVPAGAQLAQPAPAAAGDWSRLLGHAPVVPVAEAEPVAADARYQLIGVVAPRAGQRGGVALLAVDGKPPRAVALGREVEPGGLRVLSVQHREVGLGQGGAVSVRLALAPLAEAARGQPPGAGPGMPPGLPAGMPQGNRPPSPVNTAPSLLPPVAAPAQADSGQQVDGHDGNEARPQPATPGR